MHTRHSGFSDAIGASRATLHIRLERWRPAFANLRAHKREIGDLDLCFPVHALDECIPS
jgi:hypothetical protein